MSDAATPPTPGSTDGAVGASQPSAPSPPTSDGDGSSTSTRSFVITWLLAWVAGPLGIDRFYLGKVGTAVLKLVTLGGFGLWYVIDLVLVLIGAQRDAQGLPLRGYREHRVIAWVITGVVVVAGAIVGAMSAGADEPSAAASPTPSASATTQPSPSATPSGTPTASASPSPTASASSSSSSSPIPSGAGDDVVAWADETYGSFETLEQSGTGNAIIALPDGADAGLLSAEYSGDGAFTMHVLDAGGDTTIEGTVLSVGAYSGTVPFGLGGWPGEQGTQVEVIADDAWTLTIAPVSSAPALAESGTGAAVFLYDGDDTTAQAQYEGDAAFTVAEFGDDTVVNVLVLELGAFEGDVDLSEGPTVIAINADTAWSLELD